MFLLRHLLCYGAPFALEQLEESTRKISVSGSSHWTPEKVALLNEIYRVRQKEIEFEDNGASKLLAGLASNLHTNPILKVAMPKCSYQILLQKRA